MDEVEMTGLGLMTYFLGIEFHKSKMRLLMHQRRYTLEILKKYEMEHCNAVISPVEPMLQLSKNEDEEDVDPTKCRRLIGSLCYLCNTQPNLSFSVGIVSRIMERPKVSHIAAVKRILRYVKGSVSCRILFPTVDSGIKCNFLDFTEYNWCGDKDDRKPTAGYIFMFGAIPISWCSKKEMIVPPSSYEVEYIAVSLCACQIIWLMNLLEELCSSEDEAVTLLVDNFSAINPYKNPIAHGMSKHIEMRFYYFRELVRKERLRLGYCISKDQVADLLTKRVTNDVFKRLKICMGMVDSHHLN